MGARQERKTLRLLRYASMVAVAGLLHGCLWVEVENLGSGFFVLVWVTEGIGHTGRERDLYYRSNLGVPRLIHEGITGAWVSPSGKRVLFFAWSGKPGFEILYLFDCATGETLEIAEGAFDVSYGSSYWSPKEDRFIYQDGALFLFDAESRQRTRLLEGGYVFIEWSPSGERIALMESGSFYDVNALFEMDIDDGTVIEVARREGWWKPDEVLWEIVNGEERIVVKD